jgi:hypothetical protein
MNYRKALLLTALLAACFAAANCKKKQPDPNDSTPPTVVIKVRGGDGQYEPATETALSMNGSLDLMCLVEDPEGVKSVELSYAGTASKCNVEGDLHVGSFQIKPLPPPAKLDLQGDSSGDVTTSAPVYSQLKGPFSCTVSFLPPGVPSGQEIKVNCGGTNWSENDAVKFKQTTLIVKLQ